MLQYNRKNIIYSAVLLLFIGGLWLYRNQGATPNALPSKLMIAEGETMGTTYNIKYLDSQERNFKRGIDSILVLFNQCLSTYIPDSEISEFNNKVDSIKFKLPFFYPVLKRSQEVYEASGGAFDPTVMSLVKAWGFGPNKKDQIERPKMDSLLSFVGFNYLLFDQEGLRKAKKNVQIDFNAIAQGYGVDVIGDFLEEKGITDFMIEIGGEVLCKGKNEQGNVWTIGIANPQFEEKGGAEVQAIVKMDNKALATSGNYRKFYMKDGKKYAHTIDPKTGYPVLHSLLSATVFAQDAMSADAFATAMMVLGKEKAIALAKKEKLEIFLVYDEGGKIQTYISESIKSAFVQ
ncbi:MAG: FAD:protein FMN transferase [Cytophagales bacterium]|nr:MAG: FAD:protein FMN transferase [Cytophagales bacterium]